MTMKTVLISLDTLYAAHLGCYGWRFDTTPCIDRWAAKGVLFKRCYATDVPTPPSYTAMFSGRYGMHNGIFGFQDPTSYMAGPPMLQQHFEKAGHETCAISNLFYPCPWLLPGWRTMMPPGTGFQRGEAPDVTDTAIAWLDRNRDEDFFLFVHYWEPHQPYNKAPEAHRRLFPTEPYRGIASDLSMIEANPLMRAFYREYHRRGEGDPDLSSEEVTARYDSQIHFVDAEVGRLLDWLENNALAEETVVVLTSDHGEAFGEYGSFDHFTCYENITHVPLIIRAPARFPEGREVEGLVCGADIYATLLELAGFGVPEGVDSRSLVDAASGGGGTPHDFVVVDTNSLCAQRMIVRDNWGLVHTINRGPYDHVAPWELFELDGDPEKDLSQKHPDVVRELRGMMQDWVETMTGGGIDPLVLAAHRGGWTFGHGSFTRGVLEHLETAAANPHVWESVRHAKGASALDLLPRLKDVLGR
jgi:arylsulfatase A-like enzyme